MYTLVKFIGFETDTEQVSLIMRNILITVVINTGFLSLLVNGNF